MKDVREVAERARARLGERGQGTILFLDEVHRFSRRSKTCCCRSSKRVCSCSSARRPRTRSSRSPARCSRAARCSGSSRSTTPTCASSRSRALADRERGLGDEPTEIDDDALEHLVDKSEGDARHLLTVLEVAHALAVERGTGRRSRSTTRRPRSRCAVGQLRRRRALRHRLGVHQVDSRLGSRRRRLLAGAHARGRRGRALHRAPPRDPRVGGHRPRRSAGDRSSPTPRRAPSSTSACPRPRSTSRTRCSTSRSRRSANSVDRARSARPRRRSATGGRARSRCTCGTRTTAAHSRSGHGAGLRLSSRRAAGLGAAGAPAGGGGRASSSTGRARHGAEPGCSHDELADSAAGDEEQRKWVTMSAGDVLAVVAATVVTMLVAVLAVVARRCSTRTLRDLRGTVDRRCTTKRSPLLDEPPRRGERRRDRGRPGRAARHVGRATERRGRRRVAHGRARCVRRREGDGVRHGRVARGAALAGRRRCRLTPAPRPPPSASATERPRPRPLVTKRRRPECSSAVLAHRRVRARHRLVVGGHAARAP